MKREINEKEKKRRSDEISLKSHVLLKRVPPRPYLQVYGLLTSNSGDGK
jgi:hypothetical protein